MASSTIKKKGFGALVDLGSGGATVTQDGIYTLIGLPNSGYTGDTVIRVKVTSGATVYSAGCQSSLGVNPCVTIPVRKGDRTSVHIRHRIRFRGSSRQGYPYAGLWL